MQGSAPLASEAGAAGRGLRTLAVSGWKKSWMRCASFGVTFGTAASSATEAVRTRRAEPSVLRRLVRIVGPTPGIWSRTETIVRFWRSFLWYVIAKRCASSRIRWSVWSAGEREVEDERLEAARVVDLLRALGQGDDGQVVEPELLQHA